MFLFKDFVYSLILFLFAFYFCLHIIVTHTISHNHDVINVHSATNAVWGDEYLDVERGGTANLLIQLTTGLQVERKIVTGRYFSAMDTSWLDQWDLSYT